MYFVNSFWVGVFEHIENKKLFVYKVTFEAEPKDYEELEFVLKNYSQFKFSPSVDVKVRKEGEKSEANTKKSTKISSRRKRKAEQQRQNDLKQQKRKEKYRGR